MRNAAGRHAEIARRYDKHKGERQPVSRATLRIAELRRLLTARYGLVLTDDDAGRGDAFIMGCHLAMRPEADQRIPAWLSLWCPWMPPDEVQGFTARIIAKPIRWRADKLAARLHLTEDERRRLRITTIGAIDLTKEQRKARRKLRNRLLKQAGRRQAGARQRSGYEANSLSRTKPWERLGMSRRSWYRAGKPVPP
jgi:hypothetical protein